MSGKDFSNFHLLVSDVTKTVVVDWTTADVELVEASGATFSGACGT